MNKISWKWLAGFTDGEGNFAIVGGGPRITWGQNDKSLMDQLNEFLMAQGYHPNYYSIAPKPPKRPNRFYLLNLARRSEILIIMDILEPLMILKPPQIKKVREWMNSHPAKQNYDALNLNEIKSLISEGYSGKGIAQKFNCERQKIYNFAHKNGLRFYPAGGRSINGKRLPNVRW